MDLKFTLKEILGRLRGKKRYGPVSMPHYRLALDLAKCRNRILSEPDQRIRDFLLHAMSLGNISRSQIFQDAFVLYALGGKTNGYFCDFGATDGVFLSNSYMLEKNRGWTGICAEPALSWHENLRANRPGAIMETRCVWSRSGEMLEFSETRSRELSTISRYEGSDNHSRRRRNATTYQVETISLNDMLEAHGAPADFDYLSMDTEGSELDILMAFDLDKYRPKVMTIEHNYSANRAIIHDLLTAKGYRRVLEEVSLFDDWYLAPGIRLPGE